MRILKSEPSSLPTGTTLFYFNGVPIVAQPDFWPIPVLLTGALTWLAGRRKPESNWSQRLKMALLAMPVALFADIGHAMAHTISARMAGMPMDEILLSSGMPRTLYQNNDILPQKHIHRSLGGLVFSLVCSIVSLIWRRLSPRGSLSRDLAEVSLAGHSFILLGSILPLPIVDGGIILKWRLVQAGQSPEQADRSVKKASIRFGAVMLGFGALIGFVKKKNLFGGLLAAGGAAGIAAGIGWLK